MAWINSFLSSVGEVLAPSVHTPLEEFKTHFRIVRNYYIDGKYDVESFQKCSLPEHLISMMTTLLEEERNAKDYDSSGGFQPCLEFFMQQKIMETLCLLGEKDMPKGVRKLVLQTISTLLGDMPHSLLPNMSVHKPVCSLIQVCAEAETIENTEFVILIHTIASHLKKDPHLVEFFFRDSDIPHPVHADQKLSELVPFKALTKHFKDLGVAGEKSKESILLFLQLPSQNTIDYIWKYSSFPDIVVADLINLYNALPELKDLNIQSEQLTKFVQFLKFCNNMLLNTPYEEKTQFLLKIEEEFMNTVLGPSLLQFTDEGALTATMYAREILLNVDSAEFLNIYITFLIGEFSTPETEEDETDHFVRATLIKRMESENELLCLATLKLFSSLLGLYNKQVIFNLVLRNLGPCNHLLPGQGSIEDTFGSPNPRRKTPLEDEFENIKKTITSYLTLLPDGESRLSSYETYLSDAQELITLSQQSCNKWQFDQDLQPTNFHITLIEFEEDHEEYTNKFYGGGLFLTILLRKLENMLNQSLQLNLLVTGIFIKLAQYPFPILYTFLLDKELKVRPGVTTLWPILQKLADRVKEEAVNSDYSNQMEKAHKVVADGIQSDETNEKHQFYEAVIVLEEFCKELAANWQIWNTHTQ